MMFCFQFACAAHGIKRLLAYSSIANAGYLLVGTVAQTRDGLASTMFYLVAYGFTVLAADGSGETDLYAADDLLRGPVAWLFGNEAWGLPPEVAALADHRVRIPIPGRAESLNLATAAAVRPS